MQLILLFEQLLESQPSTPSLCASLPAHLPIGLPFASSVYRGRPWKYSIAHMVWEKMAGCLEAEVEKWPWPQPSGMELPAPFQALARQLQAYSCHLSCWAGKLSRLTGDRGLTGGHECWSCPRKGCSKSPMRKSLKPDTGQHRGDAGAEPRVSGRGGH